MKKLHEKKTLMGMSKDELAEHVMCLEHNLDAMEQSFEIQYANCIKMVADMNLLNDTLSKSRALANGSGKPKLEGTEW